MQSFDVSSTTVDSLCEAAESEILLRGLSSIPRFIVWVESVKETGERAVREGEGRKKTKNNKDKSPHWHTKHLPLILGSLAFQCVTATF